MSSIHLSALLPSTAGAPTGSLPALSAILGPLPPSAPLNVARNVLDLAGLDDFESGTDGKVQDQSPLGKHARVLIITGPRASFHAALEDEDEPHLRPNALPGADARVDIRYCPSAGHARLLLTLLTSSGKGGTQTVYDLESPPLLIILHDLLSLFDENDENRPPGAAPFSTTPASTYLDLIAAAKAAATHLHASLLVLEPRAPQGLPILPSTSAATASVPATARERRVPLDDGVRWILGSAVRIHEHVKEPERASPEKQIVDEPLEEDLATTYTLEHDDEKAYMRRRPVPKAEFAVPASEDGSGQAWEWAWCDDIE